MEIDVRFAEGSVLYFNPFVFPDGGTPKPKYFIVLKHVGEKLLLASLPTSKDNVPSFIIKSHGCIENPDINFNCYYFDPAVEVCDNGFSFPMETYVYGFRLKEFDVSTFLVQETQGDMVIEEKGKLMTKEYVALVQCLALSKSVKRGYRTLLQA